MRMILHPVRLSSVEAQQQKLSSELSVKLGYVYFFTILYFYPTDISVWHVYDKDGEIYIHLNK